MVARRSTLVPVVAVVAMTAGCGSSAAGSAASRHRQLPAQSKSHSSGGSVPGMGQGGGTIPAPPPTGIPASPASVAVIKAWSDALRSGDVARAAGYFAVPSVMINGPDANGNAIVIRIRTRADAEAANATLPCGAEFISADQRGRYVNALFRLTDRPGFGGGCGSGIGQTARTNFVISAKRIVEWVRAPDDPGDNAGPPQSAPSSPPGANAPAV